MKKIIALVLACMMLVGVLAACGETKDPAATNGGSAGPQKISLKVWGPQSEIGENNSGWLPTMCEAFDEAHPEWDIEFTYEVCGEGDAGTNVTKDPSAAGDIYFYANDQLGVLLQAEAIARLGGAVEQQVKDDNTEGMVNSVSVDGKLYGVPFTTNTWFMYYNTDIFTAEDVKSLETMLAKGKVAFPLTNSWYLGSFYVGNGGTLFGDGTDGSKGIQFGGANGEAVTKYLVDLAKNPNFVNDADGAGMSGLKNGTVGAIFSGTWDAKNVKEALGDKWAAVHAPTFTIDGTEKQMTAFGGSKAIGVNPHSKNPGAAAALAAYLATPEAQLSHYEANGTAPVSKKLLAENETIMADLSCAAAVDTVSNFSITQPSIPEMGNFWGPVESMGKDIFNGGVTAENAAEKTAAMNTALNPAS